MNRSQELSFLPKRRKCERPTTCLKLTIKTYCRISWKVNSKRSAKRDFPTVNWPCQTNGFHLSILKTMVAGMTTFTKSNWRHLVTIQLRSQDAAAEASRRPAKAASVQGVRQENGPAWSTTRCTGSARSRQSYATAHRSSSCFRSCTGSAKWTRCTAHANRYEEPELLLKMLDNTVGLAARASFQGEHTRGPVQEPGSLQRDRDAASAERGGQADSRSGAVQWVRFSEADAERAGGIC